VFPDNPAIIAAQPYGAAILLAAHYYILNGEAWMQQQHITHQSQTDTILAPDPLRKNAHIFWTCISVIIVVCLAAFIISLFIPQSFRDEISWSQTSDTLMYLKSVVAFLPIILAVPFISNTIDSKKWKLLEQDRQDTVKGHFNSKGLAKYALPEIFVTLPATISIQVRRNWRSTWIYGSFYGLLLGILFLTQALDWQANIQYLIRQGEISGWAFLGSIPDVLMAFLPTIFISAIFILAPRQRLIATQDGLICYRYWRFSYIPWHEARLFAAVGEYNQTIVYELASSTQVIRWASRPTALSKNNLPEATMGLAPLGLIKAENPEEYQWQVRQLTAMVADRIGLPLYDLRQ